MTFMIFDVLDSSRSLHKARVIISCLLVDLKIIIDHV